MLAEKLTELGIDLKGRTAGQFKTKCPKCSETRKHKQDPCLSVNIDKGTFMCHNPGCEWNEGGGVYEKRDKVYVLPKHNNTSLSEKTLAWFKNRGISEDTVRQWHITESKHFFPQVSEERTAINFNYFRDGELINVKYRDSQKNFMMSKGAELIFYGLDKIDGQTTATLTEGELDSLAYFESGIQSVCSVPNGASKGSLKMEYLDNCIEAFKDKEIIYIATDNDDPGIVLRNELARRLGKSRCRWIDFGDCKDANEYLLKYGKERLAETLTENVHTFPIEGIIRVNDFESQIDFIYKNGFPKGYTVGHDAFDRHIRYLGGQWTLVVGLPGSGKSEVIDQITMSLGYRHGWKTGMFSSESMPYEFHFTKLAEKFCHKRWQDIKPQELKKAKEWIHEHFYWVNISDKELTPEKVIERYENLVVNAGVKAFVIDPWNQLDHQFNGTETQYINKALSKITSFVQATDTHLFLVVHPTKPQKTKEGSVITPKLSDAAGSMNFSNKSYNGFVVVRDFETNQTEVHVQKIKFKYLGSIGVVPLNWSGAEGGTYWKLSNGVKQEQAELSLQFPNNLDDMPF